MGLAPFLTTCSLVPFSPPCGEAGLCPSIPSCPGTGGTQCVCRHPSLPVFELSNVCGYVHLSVCMYVCVRFNFVTRRIMSDPHFLLQVFIFKLVFAGVGFFFFFFWEVFFMNPKRITPCLCSSFQLYNVLASSSSSFKLFQPVNSTLISHLHLCAVIKH